MAHPLDEEGVRAYIDGLFGEDLHAARVRSLSDGTLGLLHATELGVAAIGRGLAAARGLLGKHAVKQVDRLLSNPALQIETLAERWVPAVLGEHRQARIILDWTEADAEDHSTLMASLQTEHGRSTPLLWKTVRKSELAGQRAWHEDHLLLRLSEVIPKDVAVTIVADRAFGDQELYALLASLGWGYVIRFRRNITVTSASGESRPAAEWVGQGGRMRVLPRACVTEQQTEVGSVVVVQDKDMDDLWCLAVGDPSVSGALAKQIYGKRFTTEELFRDLKDPRFGLGLSNCAVRVPDRRDRLILLAALAQRLLVLLGEAGERAGLDRLLKVNTSKKRSLSLLKQGLRWYDLMPKMPEGRLRTLMNSYQQVLQEHPVLLHIFQTMGTQTEADAHDTAATEADSK
jgi:hypothetical protein